MQAQQVSAKLYAAGAAEPDAVVRMFHRWIQSDAIDELMIDVVDYSHVHRGPGVLLITHEGEYSFGDGDGRLGLGYTRKRDEPGPLADKLDAVLARLLEAAALLERDLDGVTLRADELSVRVHNRLLAPNDADTLAAARPELEQVAARLYPDAAVRIEHLADPKQLFAVRLHGDGADLSTLRARLTPTT